MVLVDASVLIDFVAGRANRHSLWLKHQVDLRPFGITTLTLAEVMQGIRSESQSKSILVKLSFFRIFEIPDRELALASARNYRELRALGFTIRSTIDCLIATFCLERDHLLLHRDRDYEVFERHLGLRVVDPPDSAPQ